MTRTSLLRILDANTNRALEGLRVAEEIVRFHAKAPPLFAQMRALRHAIARAVRALPISPVDLVRARDSRHDIGRRAPASRIGSLERLLLINFQRAKESLRTLEECARLVAPRHVSALQRLRFRLYAIEQQVVLRLAAVRHR